MNPFDYCLLDACRYDFMQRALVTAFLIGLAAPAVGVFLVQRRLSLMGDGIGHVAFAGVAAGFLTGADPVLAALVAAIFRPPCWSRTCSVRWSSWTPPMFGRLSSWPLPSSP
jgi:ABC-type Mn2+/Zn2+ transport system permease subunit